MGQWNDMVHGHLKDWKDKSHYVIQMRKQDASGPYERIWEGSVIASGSGGMGFGSRYSLKGKGQWKVGDMILLGREPDLTQSLGYGKRASLKYVGSAGSDGPQDTW